MGQLKIKNDTNKEGKYVKPINMGTNHIINTLNLILKRCDKNNLNANDYQIYKLLREELKLRQQGIRSDRTETIYD